MPSSRGSSWPRDWTQVSSIADGFFTAELLGKPQYIHSLQKIKMPESVQFSSVAQSCPTLCDPMNRSTPGLSVHHQLPEFTQTHVHRVSDAMQPSHPLSSPSPPAPNPSQHQSLFQWVNSSHEVAKVLEFQLSTCVIPIILIWLSTVFVFLLHSLKNHRAQTSFTSGKVAGFSKTIATVC